MRSKSPCLDCKNRYPGCHSICEAGKAYAQKSEEKRALVRMMKGQERVYSEYKACRIIETKKRYGME